MSPRSRKEYIEVTSLRYQKASRKRKTAILDEFCATCQCHRKHAIRLLRSLKRFIKPNIKKRGRTPLYHKESILKPLKQIWLAANLPCSKRLKVILPLWLPGYVQLFGPLSLRTQSPKKYLCLYHGSTAQPYPNPIQETWQIHDQTRNPLKKTNPYQYQSMGQIPTRLSRSRHRRPLRRLPLRDVRLYH